MASMFEESPFFSDHLFPPPLRGMFCFFQYH